MRSVISLVAVFATASAFAGSDVALLPGDKAPELKVDRWVKGSAPSGANFRVVEFWATWCGPCKTSIPHLTELAHKFKGKVDFVGVSVYERPKDPSETPALVSKFVTDMGAKMDYNVAMGATDKFMEKNWMEAAGQGGIPTAFIVDKAGKVVWIGHPMNMEKPLESALAGTLDVAKERAAVEEGARKYMAQRAATITLKKATALYAEGKKDEAESLWNGLEKDGMGAAAMSSRLNMYVSDNNPKLAALTQVMVNGSAQEQSAISQVAYRMVMTATGDKKWASDVATQICAKSNELTPLYYAGLIFNKTGDKASAATAYDKAIVALDKANDPRYATFRETLVKARDAAKSN